MKTSAIVFFFLFASISAENTDINEVSSVWATLDQSLVRAREKVDIDSKKIDRQFIERVRAISFYDKALAGCEKEAKEIAAISKSKPGFDPLLQNAILGLKSVRQYNEFSRKLMQAATDAGQNAGPMERVQLMEPTIWVGLLGTDYNDYFLTAIKTLANGTKKSRDAVVKKVGPVAKSLRTQSLLADAGPLEDILLQILRSETEQAAWTARRREISRFVPESNLPAKMVQPSNAL